MSEAELEATLIQIGERLDYPAARHLATAVRARLRKPRPRRSFWTLPALAPALVTVGLLLLVVALGSPGLRSAAGEFLHLRGIDIFPVPSVATIAPSLPITLPGQRTSLEEAQRRVRFTLRVPTAAELGVADDVFVDTSGTSERVTLVYRERAGIPASTQAGVSALVVEFPGALDEILVGKAVGPGTLVEAVTVNGGRGFWLEGAPHLFFYRDPNGANREETLRLAGNTLVWEQNGLTIRLEAALSKEAALRVASTFR